MIIKSFKTLFIAFLIIIGVAASATPTQLYAQAQDNSPRLDIFTPGSEELPHIVEPDQDAPGGPFGALISQFLRIALVVAGLLVLLNLIIGAFNWISAGGDTGKLEKARTRIMNSIIGIIVLAAAMAILQLLFNFLNLEGLTIQDTGEEQTETETPATQPTTRPPRIPPEANQPI